MNLFRLVDFHWFLNCIWARPQESSSVRHSNSEYSSEIASGTGRLHRDHSTPPAQSLSRGTRRLQARFGRWMPDVVCQLVGIGMVPWYVMKRSRRFELMSCCHMEMGSMWTRQSTMFGALSFTLWWTYTNSNGFMQQWRGLSSCLLSMRVCKWPVVELGTR